MKAERVAGLLVTVAWLIGYEGLGGSLGGGDARRLHVLGAHAAGDVHDQHYSRPL